MQKRKQQCGEKTLGLPTSGKEIEGAPQEQLEAVHIGRAEMSGLFVGQSQNISKEPCEGAFTGGCPLLPRKL